MYRRISETLNEPLGGKILGISGIDAFRPLISKQAEVLDVHYPEVDMQNLPFKDSSFDYVISDQVIEHLENPKKAILESHRVLKNYMMPTRPQTYQMKISRGPFSYEREG